jgi:diphthamide biosynthesis protein 3
MAENIYDEIEIEDMTYDKTLEIYHYPCPCGDRFEIGIADLRDGEDIAVCPSCSLMIRVIFEVVSTHFLGCGTRERGGLEGDGHRSWEWLLMESPCGMICRSLLRTRKWRSRRCRCRLPLEEMEIEESNHTGAWMAVHAGERCRLSDDC